MNTIIAIWIIGWIISVGLIISLKHEDKTLLVGSIIAILSIFAWPLFLGLAFGDVLSVAHRTNERYKGINQLLADTLAEAEKEEKEEETEEDIAEFRKQIQRDMKEAMEKIHAQRNVEDLCNRY